MNKFTFLIIALFISFIGFAQTNYKKVSNEKGKQIVRKTCDISNSPKAQHTRVAGELVYEGFENGIPADWTFVDKDGDGHNWLLSAEASVNATYDIEAHTGSSAIVSESYLNTTYESLNANNWMITAAITIPNEGEYLAQWYELSHSADYQDNYSVYIGTSNNVDDLEATTPVINNRTAEAEWTPQIISLSEYAGQTIYIAFQHQTYDKFLLLIDDFSVFEVPTSPEIALTRVMPADETELKANEDFSLSAVITNNGVTLNSYTVSYTIDNGNPVSATVENITVDLRQTNTFTFDNVNLEAGEHTIVVTVSNPNGEADDVSDNSLTINVYSLDCNEPVAIPYSENFNDGIPVCYTVLDANNDANTWEIIGYEDDATNFSPMYYCGEVGDDYLITQPLAFETGDYTFSFDYSASVYAAYNAIEKLKVFIGNAPTAEAMNAGTTIVDFPNLSNLNFETFTGTISIETAGTYYIGFYAYTTNGYYMLIDNISIVSENTAAIDENIASAIAVYPNPTNNIVTIANAEGQNITVVNSLGQVVANIENATSNQIIDVSNFANGTYFVKVNAEIVKLNVVK